MANNPNALWLCVNPQLSRFNQRLCKFLNRHVYLRYWSYHQTPDEPCSLDTALLLLHDYMEKQQQPIHLLGHGLSGAVGLLYARLYPHRVKSLTLLAVGANPIVGWHAHYYTMRNLLPCGRAVILAQVAQMLLGTPKQPNVVDLARRLAQVLDSELSPHSLMHVNGFSPGGIEPPLLIGNGGHDAVIDPRSHDAWREHLRSGDQLWSCPKGRYFFHYDYPQLTGQVILRFWQRVNVDMNSQPLVELAPPALIPR